MFSPWQLLDPHPFPVCSTFGQPSLEQPCMPCILWYQREVQVVQTPNLFMLQTLPRALHSHYKGQIHSSAWLLFSSRPNLRPSPWRIFLLFTMWIIYFISNPLVLCVLHPRIYNTVQRRTVGAQIKHWTKFQNPDSVNGGHARLGTRPVTHSLSKLSRWVWQASHRLLELSQFSFQAPIQSCITALTLPSSYSRFYGTLLWLLWLHYSSIL